MKIFFLIIILLFINNCTLNKVTKHHGVIALDKKEKTIQINQTNKNDVVSVFGPPSIKSTFNDNLWIYIERETSKSSIFKLGKKEIVKNDVLLLEFNTMGLLASKNFYSIDKMNDLDFSKMQTENVFSKNSFVYDFLSSMRQKINDPLGKRKK